MKAYFKSLQKLLVNATCTIFILLGALPFLALVTKFRRDEKISPVVSNVTKNDVSLLFLPSSQTGQKSSSKSKQTDRAELCQMMKHRDKPKSALKRRLPKAIMIGIVVMSC